MKQTTTDILIIGSGPVGAAYARIIHDALPEVKIMMIDLGPKVSDTIGQHVKNITDPKAVERAQILSQGPEKKPYPMISVAERAIAAQKGDIKPEYLARAGTHLVTENPEDLKKSDMPAASMSSNLGGMGIHWTCACPRPGNEEKIPFIPEDELEAAFEKAEELLHVTQKAFPQTEESENILSVLNEALGKHHSPNRQAQPMPLACQTDKEGNRYWSGPDVILEDIINSPNFELRSETICRQLITSGDDQIPNLKIPKSEIRNITGAVIEHLPTKTTEEITAKIVIAACDALRTPQLLWASGIRLKALGHYLNEHPFIFTFVELNPISKIQNPKSTDPVVGVFWVPFDAPNHPFHGQIMHMDMSPMKTTVDEPGKHIVGLGWGCIKQLSFDDQIIFSETEKDYFGMPKMSFKYRFSEEDEAAIEAAKKFQSRVAALFGKEIKDGQQTLMPAGSSLHYEGTTRMGTEDDGTSVCNTYSEVWGYDNLYVGGNGVIPMATTSNPTLTSVAMAVRSAEKIISILKVGANATVAERISSVH
jgi:choline dehydrogenase-like flavoprotein